MIAGPQTKVMGDSLLHTIFRHLERHHLNFVLVRIYVGLQGDVVPFVSFYCFRVSYGPTLTVLVAHKHLAIFADFSRDTNRFHGRVRFAGVRLLRSVLSYSDCGRQQDQRE